MSNDYQYMPQNLKTINITKYLIISISIGIFVFALLYYGGDKSKDSLYEGDYIGLHIESLKIGDQTINFPYTDNNEGETIIIKSDKKIYKGGDRSDVYFSLTNTGDQAEKIAILSYFPREYGDIDYVDV